VYSAGMGSDMYRSGDSAHYTRLLWLFDPNVLEETQGQAVQEGRQDGCRHEECSDAQQRHEGKGFTTRTVHSQRQI